MKEIEEEEILSFIQNNKDILGNIIILPKESVFKEMKKDNLKNNDTKSYIVPIDNYKPPECYTKKGQYIIHHDFKYQNIKKHVYDNILNHILSYRVASSYADYKLINLESKNIIYTLKIDSLKKEKKELSIKIDGIKGKINVLKTNKDKIVFKSMKGINEIEFTEKNIIVKFNKFIYRKIVFDYKHNILEIDFNKVAKIDLNIESIKNIKKFEDIIKKIEGNLEVYQIIEDNKYKIVGSNEELKNQILLIKMITDQKDNLMNKILYVKDEIEKLELNKELNVEKAPLQVPEGNEFYKLLKNNFKYSYDLYYRYINVLYNISLNDKTIKEDILNIKMIEKILKLENYLNENIKIINKKEITKLV